MTTEIFEGKDGQFYFRFRNDDGKQLLKSEGYASKSGAKGGVKSTKKNLKRGNQCIEKKTNTRGKYFFNVLSTNTQIVATSVPFNSAQARTAAIKYLIQGVQSAS